MKEADSENWKLNNGDFISVPNIIKHVKSMYIILPKMLHLFIFPLYSSHNVLSFS